jgi:hypothetical protein
MGWEGLLCSTVEGVMLKVTVVGVSAFTVVKFDAASKEQTRINATNPEAFKRSIAFSPFKQSYQTL